MGKTLYIAEKPSVALEFARVLGVNGKKGDGYVESEDAVVTWCVGHLITMSYPDAYDPALKRWSLDRIPFIPAEWKYEVIESVKKQFGIVAGLLNRKDVDTIYVCTDSGREGEYIYRLVRQEAHVTGKTEKRVFIDSQTEEEIRRGVREAKDLSYYDPLAASAYLRAKEDYLMGINFSRALTLKFGGVLANSMKTQREVVSVGRVMTCVLGMVVRREREIRDFKVTPFYRVIAKLKMNDGTFEGEWKAVSGSKYFESPVLYKENGFRKKEDAENLISMLSYDPPVEHSVVRIEKKQEKKKAPLLLNLAEFQNECSKRFRISPDAALNHLQQLYEKKLVTYPRTDARVLSTAVAKEIHKNIGGLRSLGFSKPFAEEILSKKAYVGIEKSQYTNDSKITDHYAIIPTGQTGAFASLPPLQKSIYELVVRRFLAIFYPPAVYEKIQVESERNKEHFFSNFRAQKDPGYLKVYQFSEKKDDEEEQDAGGALLSALMNLKKGDPLPVHGYEVKEGQTTPPKRYTSGSLILAMENAGQLIEDEELRANIKGLGIGTSATRAEILKKLVTNEYLQIQSKTQVVTPREKGELIFEIVSVSLPQLLNPELTASWEKGLGLVSDGKITEGEYMEKMSDFVKTKTERVKGIVNPTLIRPRFDAVTAIYRKK